jgi:membrane protease YdiL (CAAX protease family)
MGQALLYLIERDLARTVFLCLIYLIAIAGAELITALVSPMGGMIFHLVLLISLILSSAVVSLYQSHRLFLVLSLAPLIRVLALSMSMAQFSEIYWYLFISIPLFAGILAIIRVLNLQPREIAFTGGVGWVQGLIALSGVGFGAIACHILRPEPLIRTLSLPEIIAPALILLVATGFVEELAFRGVMQRASVQVLGRWGWVYIAVLYSVLQIGHLSALHWLFVLLVAIFFGWAVEKTGSILGVSLSHGLINIGLYLIFPFVL